jgi:hypothetical protein
MLATYYANHNNIWLRAQINKFLLNFIHPLVTYFQSKEKEHDALGGVGVISLAHLLFPLVVSSAFVDPLSHFAYCPSDACK